MMSLSFGEKIKEARKAKKLTQKELANLIGAKHNSISDWENDKNKPDPDTIELLCGVLGMTPNYLLAASPDEFSPIEKLIIAKYRKLDSFGRETIDVALSRETKRVEQLEDMIKTMIRDYRSTIGIYPDLHNIACAGSGFYFEDIPTDTIEAPYMEGADFIIGVSGDSMEPTYHHGDKVYVEKRQIIDIGEIGIFMVNNECLIKEAGENGLISHNSNYNIIPGDENIICIGKVLGKVPDSNADASANNIDDSFELYSVNMDIKRILEADKKNKNTGKIG